MSEGLSFSGRRNAALFVKDIYDSERKRLRRKPRTYETVLAALGNASQIVDAAFIDPFDRYLRPHIKCALASVVGSSRRAPLYSPQIVTRAEAALAYIAEAGDLVGDRNRDRNGVGKPTSDRESL
jgi:hypothetical protein